MSILKPATGNRARILVIDLTTGCYSERFIEDEVIRQYLGGSYLGIYLWLEYSRLEVDPLSPANSLVVVPGLLTGYPVIAANRVSFVAKSPLTGLLSESTAGGYLGPRLKSAGWDGLVINGVLQRPSYLFIDAGAQEAVQVLDAQDLAGKDTYETCAHIQRIHGENIEVACIGPAGENKVFFGAIALGGKDTRAAGRTGMGAVMGSKNLKAISVKSSGAVRPFDGKLLSSSMRDLGQRIKGKMSLFSAFGTAFGVTSSEASGDLPIENWREGNFPGAAQIGAQGMAEKGLVMGHYSCWGCPIHCGKDVRLTMGDKKDQNSHGPEYETIAAFGSMCKNSDPEYVIAANDLANRLGLDTISAGSVIAFTMECFERGILDESQCGRKILWGDGEAILYLLNEIAYNRGIGRILARGVRSAGKTLGPLAQEFAVHVKGLEVPFHDPRAFTSMALNYATSARGACHLEGLTYYVEGGTYPKSLLGVDAELTPQGTQAKTELTVKMQNLLSIFNALGVCKFLLRAQVTPEDLATWIRAVKGYNFSGDDLLLAGERAFTLRRLANVALGITRKDDILPPRLLVQPRPSGLAANILPDLGPMLCEYYRLRGWDQEGLPTRKTLRRLSLEGFVSSLGVDIKVLKEG